MKLTLQRTAILTFAIVSLIFQSGSSMAFENFLSCKEGKIYDGEEEFRFISWNIPNLHNIEDNMQFQGDSAWRWPDEYEVTDALESVRQMNGKVARIYVISVKRQNDPNGNPGHVLGPGEFNEEAFEALDLVLKVARDKGIRIIIPLVDNWHWWGGKRQYEEFRGKEEDSFWSDPQLIDDFKLTIEHVLNRRNTLTGIRYCDDPTIFGWETGNELSSTAEWTRQISAYIKSIDKNHLVIEGRSLHGIKDYFFDDPNIDVVTTHHYNNCNNNTAAHVLEAIEKVDGRKAYFVGEFGFLPITEARKILDVVCDNGVCGALYWSLRFHRREGGFYWHDEPSGDGIFKAYHWPGFPEGNSYRENQVIPLLHEKAYQIENLPKAPLPIPQPPNLLATNRIGVLNWQGSTGARSYDVQRQQDDSKDWLDIATDISDAHTQYAPLFVDETALAGQSYSYRVIAKNESGNSSPSNVIGPMKFETSLFCDELNDLAKIDACSDNCKIVSLGARSTNEDINRLELGPGSEVVYRILGHVSSLRIRIYADEDSPKLELHGTSNGSQNKNEYSTLEFKLSAQASLGKDYGYLTPILLSTKIGDESIQRVKLTNTSSKPVQLSRVEIDYRPEDHLKLGQNKTTSATTLNPAVILFHKENYREGVSSVQRAAKLGATRVNIVVTMHCELDEDRNVTSYGVIHDGEFKELDDHLLEVFQQSLADTFRVAVENNIQLSIVAHLNSGGNVHDWRNYFRFDPLRNVGNYNYYSAVIQPIINALQIAKVPMNNRLDFALTGEMGSSLFLNAGSYNTILQQLRQSPITKDIRLGFSFNFNRVDGDQELTYLQRFQTNQLLTKADFIGFSNYSWFDLPVDKNDFQLTTDSFIKNMKEAGVQIPLDMPLQLTEVGLGGCTKDDLRTDNPAEAAKTPWYGTTSKKLNPWTTPEMQDLRKNYHLGLLQFLATQPDSHRITRAFIWSEGSWDPMGIRNQDFFDAEINRLIQQHNAKID